MQITDAPDLPRELWAVRHELRVALERVVDLVEYVTPEMWSQRIVADQWSVGECIVHLNITSRAFIPLIREALQHAEETGLQRQKPYRRDLMGWILTVTNEPPIRIRFKTQAAFIPEFTDDAREELRTFGTLQFELFSLISQAKDLDLNRIWLKSPFDERVQYNLYSAFRILAAHQRRHLWQAEQVIHRFGERAKRNTRAQQSTAET